MLLAVPLRPRVRLAAWAAVGLAGLALGFALNTRPQNLAGNNFLHYYLGAKYRIDYGDFYRVIQAGRDAPQVGFRDLDHPAARVRGTDPDRRAYYIDLLREKGAAFDPLVALDSLAAEARTTGAISAEAAEILRGALPEDEHAAFVEDLKRSAGPANRRPLTDDYGYNGSPFYGLLRQADPALHRALEPGMAEVGLVWQILAALGFVWIVGAAIGLPVAARVASAALLFASWDFEGYALPGLVFGELWVPVAIAAFALSRDRPVLAGAAIAWAGLVKLFPFVLVLPALVLGARSLLRRAPGAALPAWVPRLLFATAAFALVLGLVTLPFGRSWGEFLDKIRSEFLGVRMLNVVSFGQGLLLLGVRPHSWLLPILQAAGLLIAACMFLADRESDRGVTLARRALVLVAATGLFVGSWPNYYAVLPLVLLPHYAREHPRLTAALAAGFALSFLLPEFDATVLREQPWLHIVKLVPYWAAPIVMLALELRQVPWSARARRLVTPVTAALALAAVLEVGRMSASRDHEAQAGDHMARRDARGAVREYRLAGRFTPGNSTLHMSEAVALMAAGETAAARNRFERAVKLDPADPVIRDNFARMLL
ncbi:MAG: hypothetical protein HOP12_07930, partial [Candidatus Eisenbacteria bacterium]|nr:hypothetical protein [Candidatus Eisenbacteria bacterium]